MSGMRSTHVHSRRKAAWLAFAVVALAVCSPIVLAAGDTPKPPKGLEVTNGDNVIKVAFIVIYCC